MTQSCPLIVVGIPFCEGCLCVALFNMGRLMHRQPPHGPLQVWGRILWHGVQDNWGPFSVAAFNWLLWSSPQVKHHNSPVLLLWYFGFLSGCATITQISLDKLTRTAVGLFAHSWGSGWQVSGCIHTMVGLHTMPWSHCCSKISYSLAWVHKGPVNIWGDEEEL